MNSKGNQHLNVNGKLHPHAKYSTSCDDNDKPEDAASTSNQWSNLKLGILHSAILPGALWKGFLTVTVALYILNQRHMLPKPLSGFVSKALFWPTLPITVANRYMKATEMGFWSTVVDDTVIIGGAPFGWLRFPERLYDEYGVRGIINFCDEFRGPIRCYERLGITQLYLPTVDHFEPSVEDLESAVTFIQSHKDQGSKVYVHCRAGHGRSAAGVFAWLLQKDPKVDRLELNEELCKIRKVRKSLWKQPNLADFHVRLLHKLNE